MKNYQKTLFHFFIIIYCFLHSINSVYANSLQRNPYRRAHRLCYVATYYGDKSSYFDQRMNQLTSRQPYIDDFRFREGIDAWISIDRASLYSNFTDWDFQDENRRHLLANSKDVIGFINSEGFEEAIKDCAEERGLASEDLLENMRSTILRVDSMANYFGRTVQFAIDFQIGSMVLRGIVGTFRIARSFSRALISKTTTPQFRSTVSQTKPVQTLRKHTKFVGSHKAPIALGVIGAPVISATTVGDIRPQEDTIPTLQVNREDAEALVDSYSEIETPISTYDLWSLRWDPNGDKPGQYEYMIRTSKKWSLNLDLDNLNIEQIYNELSADCNDDEVSAECDLLILINMHFIDYWFLNKMLDEFRSNRGEDHQDTQDLNVIAEFFDFKIEQVENQHSSPEKDVALELLNLSRENEFLCNFNNIDEPSEDTRPDLLCKIHFFYTMRAHNGGLSPERATQLLPLEAKLETL